MLQKKLRRLIEVIILIFICICSITMAAREVSAEGTAAVKEIDLGDYQSQMVAGETQLLSITVLPIGADDKKISYSSSDSSVAKINGMGRITALKAGVTDIAVSCANVTERFKLTVVNQQTVRDLDLGDCPNEIEVGSSQILSVTIIPEEVSDAKLVYETSDADVATVNEIGRVTGIREGEVTITVVCGNIKKGLSLKVVKPKSDEVAVTDIEIGDYEDELEVDKTMTLTATVIPANSTDSTVSYQSSDENIATVNSSGEVEGIAEGNVTITISAGVVTKQVELKVKVAASQIKLDTTYLVLKVGEYHQLIANVLPNQAGQQVVFSTTTPEIVSVSASGLVTAKKCGNGEIIVRNEDISTAVTVIVNLIGEQQGEEEKNQNLNGGQEYGDEMNAETCPVITADMLKYFYTQNKNLTIYGSGYEIVIIGNQIENWENELYTSLRLKKEKQGITFELNGNKKICGPVTIRFDKGVVSGKYVYLYNTSKNKYELIKGQKINSMYLDTEGKYLVTEKKLSNIKGSIVAFVIACIVIIILIVVYIAVKKQYWFW